jgi:hypothetical protein
MQCGVALGLTTGQRQALRVDRIARHNTFFDSFFTRLGDTYEIA